MKRVLCGVAIAMACTIAVAAQSGMAAPKEMDKGKAMGKDMAKTVKVTGCVAESGGHYMLNNAMMADQAGAPMTYALTGGTLKPHVGHKVEVEGMMKPMSKDSMKHDTMSKDKMAKPDMKHDDMATGGTLTVKSLSMIAASCS